jgi:hypothetical protein
MSEPQDAQPPAPRPAYDPYPHLPHYGWGRAPSNLATDWQLGQEGLTPSGLPVAVLSSRNMVIELYDRSRAYRR